MRLAEGKDMVLGLILSGLPDAAWSVLIGPDSPDGDPGKFLINGKVARAIHRFSGWRVPVSLGWFSSGYDQPVINGTALLLVRVRYPRTGDVPGRSLLRLRLPADARVGAVVHRAAGI